MINLTEKMTIYIDRLKLSIQCESTEFMGSLRNGSYFEPSAEIYDRGPLMVRLPIVVYSCKAIGVILI